MEQNLLGTGELGKSEFRGTGSFIFEQQENMHQPHPTLRGPQYWGS